MSTPSAGAFPPGTLPFVLHRFERLSDTGVLEITHGDWTGRVAFEDGAVMAAEFDGRGGLEALEAMAITLIDGAWRFTRNPATAWDEPWSSDAELGAGTYGPDLGLVTELANDSVKWIPSLDAVAVRTAYPAPSHLTLSRSALELWPRIDGQRCIADMVRPTRGHLYGVLPPLIELLQLGLVTLVREPLGASPPPRPPAPNPIEPTRLRSTLSIRKWARLPRLERIVGAVVATVLLVLVPAVLGLGRSSLPQPAAANVPQRTASSASTQAILQSGEFRPVLVQRFAPAPASWPTTERGPISQLNGALMLFAHTPGQFITSRLPLNNPVGDVRVSSVLHKLGGPAGASYGVILRSGQSDSASADDQSGPFYLASIDDLGHASMWQYTGTEWLALFPSTPVDAVQPGDAANELTFTATGDTLSFEVNQTQIATITDNRLTSGGAAIFAAASAQVAVDNVEVDLRTP